jgi:hypothetical protein
MKPFGFLVLSFLTARVTFLSAEGRDNELGDVFPPEADPTLSEKQFEWSLVYFRDGNGVVSSQYESITTGIVAVGSAWVELEKSPLMESKKDFSFSHFFSARG